MFTHLHVHTEFSLLDGLCRIPQLIARAKEMGMDSMAITDHGVMYGAIQFYNEARKQGIKPIIGCETYIAAGDHTSKTPADKQSYHLVLLAKNYTGYVNLIQLITKAHFDGFYYKPRIDKELLKQHREGLIGMSACLGGEIPSLINQNRLEDARKSAIWYRDNLENFYLEIQRHPIAELERVNQELIIMSKELDIPLVATNDTHYLNKEDASAHDILLCIGTNATIHDEKRMRMEGDYFYLKSPEEMAEQYRDIPEALENTARIAEMCDIEFKVDRVQLPEIDIPPGKSPDEYLSDLCYAGLEKFYPNASQEIIDRLEYELGVIRFTRFANYMLVVWDIAKFVREAGIHFGVRGSAASSIVLRCLGITEIDPIESALVFERFLNEERIEMPDVDLDFQDDRREEVIEYVKRKYGDDHVAQIITFGTLGAKAALRDVGRALGMSYADVDRVAKLVPALPHMTLKKAMEESQELKSIYHQDSVIRGLIDTAQRLEGTARHASTHAAGVIIAKDPLTTTVPMQKPSRGEDDSTAMVQFNMSEIAQIGLLKMDFLGLINLNILGKAVTLIRKYKEPDFDLHAIPMDNKKTYDLLSAGDTTGVFQLEGSGMRRYIRELKPTKFGDIAAMVALYRPGPMDHIPTYIKAKNGLEEVRYPHPALENILKETYGVIVYQEQVLFIVQEVASYTLGKADVFRKAMGKKIAEKIRQEKVTFLEGAIKNGFTEQEALDIFGLIEPFSGYAFNKAHAFSYALIAYQTAYLKANYPHEYICAFLTANAGSTDKVINSVAECRRLGITLMPPDIQHSCSEFTIETDAEGAQVLRFGLSAVKNVGEGAIQAIEDERDANGPFKSMEDFCHRCDLKNINRRTMESLIKVGAFDELGDRGTLLHNIEDILSLAQREQKLKDSGQTSMFDMFGDTSAVPMPSLELEESSVSDREMAIWEKELMGISFSRKLPDPKMYDPEATYLGSIDNEMDGQTIVSICEVSSVTMLMTRKDSKAFAKVIIEDNSGSVEVAVWPRDYEKTANLWHEGNLLQLELKVRLKDEEVQVSVSTADFLQMKPMAKPKPFVEKPEAVITEITEATTSAVTDEDDEGIEEEVIEEPAEEEVLPTSRKLIIRMKQTEDPESDVNLLYRVKDVIDSYTGDDEVILKIENGTHIDVLSFKRTGYCKELHSLLAKVVDEDNVSVQPMG